MNKLQAYYYVTKPGIIYGNLLTAAAGFLFAASQFGFNGSQFAITLGGTSLVIASACVFNNYIDRHIDKHMDRTKKRALASGIISSKAALTYATTLGTIGFAGLALLTNWWVVGFGAIAFVNYIVLYGWAKRHSVHGTLVGTISGAAPVAAGYVAVTNELDSAAVLIFGAMVFWQMPHFYAIALRRLKDYTAASIPVLPAVRGAESTKRQIMVYITAYILSICLLTALTPLGFTFLVVMAAIGLYWFWLGAKGYQTQDATQWATQMFFCSLWVLLTFSIMLSVGAALP